MAGWLERCLSGCPVGHTVSSVGQGVVTEPALAAVVAPVAEAAGIRTDVAAPPLTVGGDTAISDLVDQFQAERQELALVTEDRDVVGLVTVTDAMGTITGEVWDPLDAASDRRARRSATSESRIGVPRPVRTTVRGACVPRA
jgi:CBS domain containing-hemolysin-like protein